MTINGLVLDIARNRYWYLNGQLHRESGPAAEWTDGTKCYYLNDQKYSEEEHSRLVGLKAFW